MSDDKLLHIQELLESAAANLKTANSLMRDLTGVVDTDRERNVSRAIHAGASADGKVVEGIFDGQNMLDSDGQGYPVPANYASKSKLVEGDGMKLTITDEGKFIYKQIAPIPRKTVVGVLIQEDGQYKVLAEGKVYRVLLASVTFYRAEVGDQVTILLPDEGEAAWGAIDAVIPKHVAETAAKATLTGRSKDADGELSPTVEA
ncbi:MAG: hypothetical protein KC680_03010 [Candidatus Peregrinibacteria bacterium]|nr:hypothetical protein [Candidatus Peregrinibacteria bacterium]MCB9808198.1 hypothetical protein [Candidatus Peribacteria bacterium]